MGGHYQVHTDDAPGPSVTRTLSFIFRLNNDYEGGDLVWKANNKEFYRSKTYIFFLGHLYRFNCS